ncbi:MAG: hypothetical protein ABSA81_08660 [Candidatus Bathyarchaeia archaeon]|jgi:hypothetical protein
MSVNLAHFRALNDRVGIIQFAPRAIPDVKSGYTTDDVGRALVLVCRVSGIMGSSERMALARKYFAFLDKMRDPDGRWSNEMSETGNISDLPSNRDHLGRAAWAAGAYSVSDLCSQLEWGHSILNAGLQWIMDATSPRAKAYFLLGISELLKTKPDSRLSDGAAKLASQLLGWYETVSRPSWRWFEESLTYDNARLPQSLAAYHEISGDSTCLKVASESLDFLMSVQTIDGVFAPVGNKGWYRVGGPRALYDQQPVDAGATVEACNRLYRVTGETRYRDWASLALSWYSGSNLKRLAVYDSTTGGCYDGLIEEGVNLNQGAESILSYLLAITSFSRD